MTTRQSCYGGEKGQPRNRGYRETAHSRYGPLLIWAIADMGHCSRGQADNNASDSLAGARDSVVPLPSPERDDPSSLVGWDHPLLSPGSLSFRFPASALVNSSFRTFAGTTSGDLAMGAEIALIKAQAVAYDSSVPHDGVI